MLLRLKSQRPLRGFVEDRRPTLETVGRRQASEVPCFLADWGTCGQDRDELPQGSFF